MAEATVTLKLNPAEFDLLREVVRDGRSMAEIQGGDSSLMPGDRQVFKQKALLLKALGEKLNA